VPFAGPLRCRSLTVAVRKAPPEAFAGIDPPFAENLLSSASPALIIVIEVQQ